MNLRRLIPRRISGLDGHHRAIFRMGLAYIMNGAVELTSLGKTTTDWAMISVQLSDNQWQLKKFFEAVSAAKPRPAHNVSVATDPRRARVEAMAHALAMVATGAVETLSCGYLSTDWYMLSQCYSEEVIEKIWERFKKP